MAEIVSGITANSKIIEVTFNAKETEQTKLGTLKTNKQLFTSDTDAWLRVIVEDVALVGTQATITLTNLSEGVTGSLIDETIDVTVAETGYSFEYELSKVVEGDSIILHAGQWLGQVIVKKDGESITATQFTFSVRGHILDAREPGMILVENFNTLMGNLNLLKTNLESEVSVLTVQAADTQATLEDFDIALETGVLATNIATKLTELETTYAPRLLSAEQQLAEAKAQIDLLNRGLGETFTTLSALQTTYPTGDTKDHIVGADGHRYYWSGSAWADGGIYQAIELTDKSVTVKKINFADNSDNLFDATSADNVVGYQLHYSTGAHVANADSLISHLIAVSEGDVVRAYFDYTTFGGSAKAHFYNSVGVWISTLAPTFEGNVGTVTVPSGTGIKSVRFNVKGANKASVMFVKNVSYPTIYVPFRYFLTNTFGLNETQRAEVDTKISNIGNELNGKVIVFDGDSIANAINDAQDGWAGRIAANNGMVYTNYAVDGGTITGGLMADANPRHWVSRSVAGYRADADYIIFEGGTNDADLIGIGNIGTITTGFSVALDDTIFTQAVESTLKQAILKYPGKKIGFIIAHKMGELDQQPVRKAFFDRIVECCKKWGIPYLNLWETCYLNPLLPDIKTTYYSDNQHLKSVGYDLITPIIEKWIKTL